MKLLVVICLLACIGGRAELVENEKDFIKWQETYNKQYHNEEDYEQAFEEFLRTKSVVEESNRKFSEGDSSFRQASNKFADLSADDRRKLASGFRASNNMGMSGRSVTVVNPGMFPAGPPSCDWRGKEAITPVKDQGFFCNCCWAFSAIAALESHIFLKRGILYNLSEQNLIDCNRNGVTGNWGCAGGSQSAAYMYVRDIGIETLENYPFLEDVEHEGSYSCHFNSSNSIGKIKGYYRIRPRNETILKDVVAAVGPVAMAFDATSESFMFYQDGVYDDLTCKSGYSHSALIVGYGTMKKDNGTSVDYWICKNSWSSDWGEKGYFRILRGKNLCGLTGFLIVPIVD